MDEQIEINMGNDPVRFTRDGRMFLMDAIRMIVPEKELDSLWNRLKQDHPDIIPITESWMTEKGESLPVVNIEGWNRILDLLPEYLSFD